MKNTNQTVDTTFVIASSDEGVQLNSGTRFGFVGSGYNLPHFVAAVAKLAQLLPEKLKIASAQEDDWLLTTLESKNPNLYREAVEKLAKEAGLDYIGQLDFGDPRVLDDTDTKGHLVRPPKIHVADTICFTCGGGEQTFNLRHFMVSADFAGSLPKKELRDLLRAQIDFLTQLIGRAPTFSVEMEGFLGEKVAAKNRQAILAALPELAIE
jgi:hypothetical protein